MNAAPQERRSLGLPQGQPVLLVECQEVRAVQMADYLRSSGLEPVCLTTALSAVTWLTEAQYEDRMPCALVLGQELAEALLEDWDGGEVLLLDTAGRCAGVSARLEAAEETLSAEGIPARRAEALPDEPPRWVMAFEPSVTQRTAEGREAGGRDFALYGVGSAAAITAQLERGNLAAIAAWSDYAAGYLAVRRAVNAVRGTGGALGPLPFFILREEDIYAPENQKLLFPIMSSSSR